MRWELTDDPAEYDRAVRALLTADPARHTVALTVLDALLGGRRWSDEPPVLGWCVSGGEVVGAASMTPPYELLLAHVPPTAVRPLVEALLARGVVVPGLNGDADVAEAFAAAWVARRPGRSELRRRERLHRLAALVPPDVPGRARAAGARDVALLVGWFGAFQREAGVHEIDAEPVVRERTAAGLLWVWEDPTGRVVSLAGRNPAAAGVARVGPVYTPPPERGHGYGAAVTAACTADALARDAREVVLFTDLANATSNGVYRRIGYVPLADRVVLGLVA